MSNKNFLFKFLTLVITFTVVICLTACGKQGGKEAWDLYVSGVNSQDTTKIGQSLYYNPNEVAKFVEKQGDQYLYLVSHIQTLEFTTEIECDFSNENKVEVYYASKVKARVDGQEKTFMIYSYETDKGVFLCTLPEPDQTDGSFGNKPNTNWYSKAYFTEDAYLYQIVPGKNANSENTVVISQQNKNQKNVVIPEEINGDKVTEIGAYAFYKYNKILSFTTKNSKMRTIILPNTLLKIDEYAFYQCGRLEEINIPESVNKIGAYAFSSCTNLENITINALDDDLYKDLKEIKSTTTETETVIVIEGGHEINKGDIITLSVTGVSPLDIQWTSDKDNVTIETDALNNAKIYAKSSGSVNITASLKQNPSIKATLKLVIKDVKDKITIEFSALNRCSGLENLYLNSKNPNSIFISGGVNFALSEDVTIWVPKGSLQLYQYHSAWSKYANQIREME